MNRILSSIILITIFIIDINAQKYASYETIEFGGGFSFTNISPVVDGESIGGSMNQITLTVPIYYFIENGLELGVVPTVEYYDYENSSMIGLGLFGAIAHNFDLESNLFPYLEGRIGYNTIGTTVEEDEVSLSGLGWALLGGLKTHLGGNALLNFSIGYAQQTFESVEYEGGRSGRNIIAFGIGISLFFGGDKSKELIVN